METLELNCEPRKLGTRGDVRGLRRAGKIPAVLYGPKTVAAAIVVSAAGLKTGVMRDESQRLIKFKSPDSGLDGRHVIVKELQRDPIKGAVVHADFYEVDLAAKLTVSVPLRFSGKAKGVVDGGILQPLARTVEVECLPLEIPDVVEIDVTALGIHEVIHVSALKFGPNIDPAYDTDYPLVTVLPPTVEAAPVVAAEEAAAAPEGEAAAVPAAGAAGAAAEAPKKA